MDFNKTKNIQTSDQLKDLIALQKIFYLSETGGKPAPFSEEYNHLFYRNNSGGISIKNHTWVDRTVEEIAKSNAEVQSAADLITSYQADVEKWRNDKVKPWSQQKLYEWIDVTFQRPLEYNLTADQEQERIDKRLELLEYHNQATYLEDSALVKPEPPSWITA